MSGPRCRTARVLTVAAALFAPLVVLELAAWQPFMASTLASTSAIALHAPGRFRRNWVPIVASYIVGFALAVPVTLLSVACGLPVIVPCVVVAATLLASPLGRFHPPIACLPFAVSTVPTEHIGTWQLAVQWTAACLASVYLLGALVVVTHRWPGLLAHHADDAPIGI